MLRLSSTGAVIGSIASAKHVFAEAYTLGGPVLRALENAARRGARVVVELEKAPYNDAKQRLARENAKVAAELRDAGADVVLDDLADTAGVVRAVELLTTPAVAG